LEEDDNGFFNAPLTSSEVHHLKRELKPLLEDPPVVVDQLDQFGTTDLHMVGIHAHFWNFILWGGKGHDQEAFHDWMRMRTSTEPRCSSHR
jgi:hypothetical protein